MGKISLQWTGHHNKTSISTFSVFSDRNSKLKGQTQPRVCRVSWCLYEMLSFFKGRKRQNHKTTPNHMWPIGFAFLLQQVVPLVLWRQATPHQSYLHIKTQFLFLTIKAYTANNDKLMLLVTNPFNFSITQQRNNHRLKNMAMKNS